MTKWLMLVLLLLAMACAPDLYAQIVTPGGGGGASGPAGGDLSGTYPNPTVVQASGNFTGKGTATLGPTNGADPTMTLIGNGSNWWFSTGAFNSFVIKDSGNHPYIGFEVSGASGSADVDIKNGGQVDVNNATGGFEGNGTINVSGGIYLNGTAYTSPDYVFESYYLNHRSPKHLEYQGLMPLQRVEVYTRAYHELPHVVDFKDGQPQKMDIFQRADRVLEKTEEAYLYLFDHDHRIARLEWENRFIFLALIGLSIAFIRNGFRARA